MHSNLLTFKKIHCFESIFFFKFFLDGAKASKTVFREDRDKHAGWWYVREFNEIVGPIAIEVGDHVYVKALDDGSFTLGARHEEGQGPDPEEVHMAIKINDTKIALKSGFNKYLKVHGNGQVLGISDAVGAMEQLEPIFQVCIMKIILKFHIFSTPKPLFLIPIYLQCHFAGWEISLVGCQ